MSAKDLIVAPGLVIPGSELSESASRASGPGGQNVNKRSTRVTLSWSLRDSQAIDAAQRARLLAHFAARLTLRGRLIVHAERERSQARNRALARERLAEWIRAALAPHEPRIPTRASRAARRRVLDAKRRQGARKQQRRPPSSDD